MAVQWRKSLYFDFGRWPVLGYGKFKGGRRAPFLLRVCTSSIVVAPKAHTKASRALYRVSRCHPAVYTSRSTDARDVRTKRTLPPYVQGVRTIWTMSIKTAAGTKETHARARTIGQLTGGILNCTRGRSETRFGQTLRPGYVEGRMRRPSTLLTVEKDPVIKFGMLKKINNFIILIRF